MTLSDSDRNRLKRIIADRNSPQKHVWWVQIVLLSAVGAGTNVIMAATGTANKKIWRWQETGEPHSASPLRGCAASKLRGMDHVFRLQ